jgi:hypothetical protein
VCEDGGASTERCRAAVVYQSYPGRDGVGDLGGIVSRLDHLTALGVDMLWLSPIRSTARRSTTTVTPSATTRTSSRKQRNSLGSVQPRPGTRFAKMLLSANGAT